MYALRCFYEHDVGLQKLNFEILKKFGQHLCNFNKKYNVKVQHRVAD